MPFRTRRSSPPLGLAALLIIAFALAVAAPLEAQDVIDPGVAEFDPSPDHWAILDDGQPAVVGYELSVYVVGAPMPFATVDMGKPSPAADGKIRYDFSKEAAAWPLPGGEYEARVSAVGSEGAALSAPSNTFTFSDSQSCAFSLSARSVRAPAGGGDYSIAVSTDPACDWTTDTTLPWVSLWATHGTGSGNLPFQVPANSSTSSRSGIITIAGEAITVSQDGAAPASSFEKLTPDAGAIGQNAAVTLTWTALKDAGYWVCWDTTNNNSCDGPWWPNGGGAGRTVTGLASGTYYWQVKAQTAGSTADANSGTWWSFTVSGSTQAPAAFSKQSPATGATGLGSALTLSWGAAHGATGYQVCVDTTNDSACSTAWQAAGAATTLARNGLTAGTYFWQVRAQNAGGTTDANSAAWWSFIVASSAPPSEVIRKESPATGATGQGSAVTLTWTALKDAGYWVCWDTTNNNSCDGPWWPNGGGAGRTVTGLASGTYYWQVKAQTAGGTADANSGTWWSFTVGGSTQAPAAFSKLSPATGATGLGSGLTLAWGTASGATAYEICVDTTNDNGCSTTWQSSGAATLLARSGLTAGTYYWQVRAQNTGGTADANGGAWWSFTVAGSEPPSDVVLKESPATGATGMGSAVTLTWTALKDAGYWVCWDTTNNNSCDAPWWPNGGGAGRTLTGLASGTYYWQVKAQTARGITEADGGTWRSFTVGGSTQAPAAFSKLSPATGATGLGSGLTLAWGTASGATAYEICVDTTNDNGCSTTWRSAWTSTSVGLSGLAAGTYYWQVRALNSGGTTYADGNSWRSFAVSGSTQPPQPLGKLSPTNGLTGQASTVMLSWSALSDAGYWVCWDTTNNNSCDGPWWPNGGGAGRTLTGLASGTYYWQVKAQTARGITEADGGTWWSFTVR